ncbi:DUF6301 family protein [Nocardia sp. NPDC051981]|uniref:DUF6301 family protein n=1 Tax=Nocardia sp. NPDC051981 TaxID=3155417 RepID=UPI00343A1E5A
MQADIEGAVRAVEVAKTFRWTWKDEDVSRFCDVAGWRIEDQRKRGATLVTDLQIDRPIAFAHFDRSLLQQQGGTKESVLDIDFRFTDGGQLPAGLRRAVLTQLNERLMAVLGTPTWSDVDGRAAWYLRRLVVLVESDDAATSIDLVNPLYQKWHDETEDH